jgi:transcriptional regulator with XRE-family HTH domain
MNCYVGRCGHPVREFSGSPADGVTMGRRLRAARRARGKSQVVIAGLAGISSGYLSMLENGRRSLDRLSLLVALAYALEIPPTELIINLWSGDDGRTGARDPRDVRAVAEVGQR